MKVVNPRLPAPPSSTIDTLERQCKVRKDKDTCRFIVELEKHYRKLEQ